MIIRNFNVNLNLPRAGETTYDNEQNRNSITDISLAEAYPEIAKYWDFTLNDNHAKSPYNIKPTSIMTYKWKCSAGHSFAAKPAKLLKKYASCIELCPICRKDSDPKLLAVSYPDIMRMWDNNRNKGTGKTIPFTSTVRYYWICDKGHVFRETPTALVDLSHDKLPLCSKCRGTSSIKPARADSLKKMHPEIAKEWNYDINTANPENVRYDSKRHYCWTCIKGHNYYATVAKRVESMQLGTESCPQCRKENDPKYLVVSYPDITNYWDTENNTKQLNMITCKSGKDFVWKCANDHSFVASPSRIAHLFDLNVEICPECRCKGNKSSSLAPKQDSIIVLYPELLDEWDYKANDKYCTPERTSVSSNKQVRWKCKHGHYYWQSPPLRIKHMNEGTEPCIHCLKSASSKRQKTKRDIDESNFRCDSIATMYPAIANEWDYDNNNGRATPKNVSYSSSTPFHWVCSCGNRYKASPANRVRWFNSDIHACPICRRKYPNIIPKDDSIGVRYPDLKKEWNIEKNKGKAHPDRISCNSTATYYWNCANGHTYKATPKEKIQNYNNSTEVCPHCKREAEGKKDSIAERYPELIKIWDYDKNTSKKGTSRPERISISSTGYYYWKCENGHNSYAMTPQKRIKHLLEATIACPKCRVYLEYAYPEIAKEWDYEINDPSLTPANVLCKSKQSYHWVCSSGHNYRLSPYLVVQYINQGLSPCPACRDNVGLIVTLYPEIASEWDHDKNKNSKIITRLLCDNTSPYYWKCRYGHSYRQSACKLVSYFNKGLAPCPVCSGRLLEEGTSLLDLHPDIVRYWDYERNKKQGHPSTVSCTTKRKFNFICSNGHHYRASPAELIMLKKSNQELCPACRNRVDEFNLVRNYPSILNEWDFDKNDIICKPYNIPYTSKTHPYFICSEGHHYSLSIAQWVLDKETGRISCPYCRDRKVWPGFNSFAVRHEDLLNEWDDDIDPDTISERSKTIVKWKCPEYGHNYDMSVNARVSHKLAGSTACPYCDDREILPGFNSFAARHHDLLSEWDFVNNYALADPDMISQNSKLEVWFICKKDPTHRYPTTVDNRVRNKIRGREPCPYCKGRMRKRVHFMPIRKTKKSS